MQRIGAKSSLAAFAKLGKPVSFESYEKYVFLASTRISSRLFEQHCPIDNSIEPSNDSSVSLRLFLARRKKKKEGFLIKRHCEVPLQHKYSNIRCDSIERFILCQIDIEPRNYVRTYIRLCVVFCLDI